jgi:hypothetical protein
LSPSRRSCPSRRRSTLLTQETGITNQAETKRRANRSPKGDEESKENGHAGLGFIHRCIERTVKFVRWLNNHLDSPDPSEQALARLETIYSRM